MFSRSKGAMIFLFTAVLAMSLCIAIGDDAFSTSISGRFHLCGEYGAPESAVVGGGSMSESHSSGKKDTISLPEVPSTGTVSVEEAIWRRRSIRQYAPEVPTSDAVSRLLWAAQGVTEPVFGLRSAPSAGATYPLEVFLATSGYLARYEPVKHCLVITMRKDIRKELSGAALSQKCIAQAPLVFIFAADVSRTAARYGDRAERYVHIEVGCASENLMLEAAALGLGSVAVGAYHDDKVSKVLELPEDWEPYLIVPVGVPAE